MVGRPAAASSMRCTDTILGRIEYRYTNLQASGFVNVPANIADGGTRTPDQRFPRRLCLEIRRRGVGARKRFAEKRNDAAV